MTGVIATVLALIFGAGAFFSAWRRNNQMARHVPPVEEEPKMRFRPPSESKLPVASVDVPQRESPQQLFRQVRPGTPEELIAEEGEESGGYVWE